MGWLRGGGGRIGRSAIGAGCMTRLFAEWIIGVAAIPFEEGAGLHREGFMQNVAFDMTGRAQQDLARADAALNASADGDIFCKDFALDVGFLADHEAGAVNVALDPAVNLNVPARRQTALNDEVAADDGGS